ncbi:polyprenyl diphosphate synthase [Agathobaculum sp. NTUH-O15-33]|uniref:polyprenyl diphosphate synthase n=1 Tax=Agathobaculum sp. NTUH-O15-33 TaxID=3079302 RepID=UPI0029588A8E|nr:polyprenyl diphosphate synthase [Agathobaculum sp. NTUH-O15-33]WNX85951.1 polyprenyl diphosphate synthase [Agathobaculum sp. NTUH-O15-33]
MRIPKHIGIIPDGNRRWAQGAGMHKKDGYAHGLTPGLEVLKLARDAGVEEITFYGFTTDNCGRPAEQVAAFSRACVDAVELIASEPVSLLVVGNTQAKAFPQALMPYTTRTDLNGGGTRVNFLVNYGWEWDLAGLEAPGKDRRKIHGALCSHDVSRVDLVIRWGGMRRLSGFLPVQAVYADFFVVDRLWPDFQQEDFSQALQWYQKQDVTLGG